MTVRELAVLRDRVARARLETTAARVDVYRVPAVRADGAVRYGTEAERLEARRRTFRESKRRAHGTCPACGGRKSPHRTVRTCRPCYLASLTPPPHGSVSRYTSRRYRCRCGPCREAVVEYHRDRRHEMKAWAA